MELERHITEDILNAVQSVLSNLDTSGQNIFRARVRPFADSELPAIVVYQDRDTPDFSNISLFKIYSNLEFIVKTFCKTLQYSDVESTLSQMRLEICRALRKDYMLGLKIIVDLVEMEARAPQLFGEGDTVIGTQELRWSAQYMRSRDNPIAQFPQPPFIDRLPPHPGPRTHPHPTPEEEQNPPEPVEDLPMIQFPELHPNLPPSGNFDLTKWKLTIPTGETIQMPDLSGGYENDDYFYTDPATGGMVFICPDDGQSTGNSSFPRCELREMLNHAAGESSDPTNNWVMSTSSVAAQQAAGGIDGTMDVTLQVDAVSETGTDYQLGRVVIGQIHGLLSDEFLLLVYHKRPEHERGAIYLRKGDDVFPIIGDKDHLNPINGIPLGERFAYRIKLIGRDLTVNIVRQNHPHVTFQGQIEFNLDDSLLYFKCGQYNQNNTGSDFVRATFFSIKRTHKTYTS